MRAPLAPLAAALALLASPASAQVSQLRAASAVASSFVIKTGSAYLTGINVTTGATAGYAMLFDATTVPADGAVTPLWCVPIAPNTGIDPNWRASPKRFTVGAILVFSSTGCFTKTASATAYLSGDVQ